jgi:hypothetical protein
VVATDHTEARRRVKVPIPVDRCPLRRMAVFGHIKVRLRVEDHTLDDQRRARPAAETLAAETAADRQVGERVGAIPEEVEEEDRAEALLPAEAILHQGTMDTNQFPPRFTHSSLTVRRLRKEPPVLPKDSRGRRRRIWDDTAHDRLDDALDADDRYLI